MSKSDPRYETRARRLLSVVRATPGIGMNELVRKACMNRERAKETVDAMVAGGLLVAEEFGGRKPLRPGPRADEFVREVDDEKAAALVDPEVHQYSAPAGYDLVGASTCNTITNPDGSKSIQWVKTKKLRDDPRVALDAFAEVARDRIRPAEPLACVSVDADDDLLAVIPFGDPHIGMLSWHLETGHDFDLKIAREVMVGAARSCVSLLPTCKRALVVSVGDTTHSDNPNNRTTNGTHQLDVDSRFIKVVRVALETLCAVVDCALLKFEWVDVVVVPGNHDATTSQHLAIMLALYYRNEPRVRVDTSPSPFRYYEFGKVLLGITHGDACKMEALDSLMATSKPEEWGRSCHRHWYTGHLHHTQVKDLMGCTAETLRTLAPPDSWHHGRGYRSKRGLFGDVWHRERGHLMRHHVGVEELGRP